MDEQSDSQQIGDNQDASNDGEVQNKSSGPTAA